MEKRRLDYIVEKTQGEIILEGNSPMSMIEIEKVYQDSRLMEKKGIFFAVKGDKFDGHSFLRDVIEKGAAALFIDKERRYDGEVVKLMTELRGNNFHNRYIPWIIGVENTQKALQDLARAYLDDVKPTVIAVTGSTGKTSTRDMINQVVSSKFKTHKNQGNFNTVVGVPLTILEMEPDAEVIVLEMGMDKIGEIETMVNIAPPKIAVITNIGLSHMERLGSQDAIFSAKMEIAGRLGEEDVLIATGKSPYLTTKCLRDYGLKSRLVLTGSEGTDGENRLIIDDFVDGEEGISFVITDRKSKAQQDFLMDIHGRHNSENAAIAVACGIELGIGMERSAKALKKINLTSKRLTFKECGGYSIIDDSYNASPDSVKAALEILNTRKAQRKIAVLGDMKELGKDEKYLHREIGEYARKVADLIFTIGPLAYFIDESNHFDNIDDLTVALKKEICPGDLILVKASHSMELDKIVKNLE